MKKYGVLVAILVVVAIVLVWWLTKGGEQPSSNVGSNSPAEAPAGLGGQVFDQVSQNPIQEKMPETNPFKAEVNPFSGAYKNPFGQ